MKIRTRMGFTIIELMVALVVAGILVTSLVSISGAVQRSFSRSRDLADLQANLRFALKVVGDDFSRVAYQTAGDPKNDQCHMPTEGPNFPASWATDQDAWAISYQAAANTLILRGNYRSTRDYRYHPNLIQFAIRCRNGCQYDPALAPAPHRPPTPDPQCNCSLYNADPTSLLPFLDGPKKLTDLFPVNQTVRIDLGTGEYAYDKVAASNDAAMSLQLQTVAAGRYPGDETHPWWLSPINEVKYMMEQDGGYASPYGAPTAWGQRWMLRRHWVDAAGVEQIVEVADFLLPPASVAAPGGLTMDVINDSKPNTTCGLNDSPVLDPPTVGSAAIHVLNDGDIDPKHSRALVITLRARTEYEDPDYVVNMGDPEARNFAVDLDGNVNAGLAHVRELTTVINLRNLGIGSNL